MGCCKQACCSSAGWGRGGGGGGGVVLKHVLSTSVYRGNEVTCLTCQTMCIQCRQEGHVCIMTHSTHFIYGYRASYI